VIPTRTRTLTPAEVAESLSVTVTAAGTTHARRISDQGLANLSVVMACPHRTTPDIGCGCIKCGPLGTRPGSKVSIDDCLSCLNLEG
jgi:hypothetical protein